MEHEFVNRIDAQRTILKVVNSASWGKEELSGLSNKAIERWVSSNQLEPTSTLVELIRETSSRLFFLANKSQEQVSEGYKIASEDIAHLRQAIEVEVERLKESP
jgi:hypothetical protein